MVIKEYKLYKSAKKTAEENNLLLVDGNLMSDHKMLFDFSFLDTLDISAEEKKAVKDDAMKHCSAANRTSFVFYHADNCTSCHMIVDFNYHRVFNTDTWKLAYAILEVKHIRYVYAERRNEYEWLYTKNMKEFEADSYTESAINDYEV